MPNTLTTASVLTCPHGGTVSISSTNTSVTAAGVALALATDTFSISGCSFQRPIPGGTQPSPCVSVQWLQHDLQTQVNSQATLSMSSQGLCLAGDQVPQGPVSISSTQPNVSSL